MRLNSDGTASLQKGTGRKQAYSGKWWVDGTKLCRGWDPFQPRFDCWPVAISGSTVSLYGDHDATFLQGSLRRNDLAPELLLWVSSDAPHAAAASPFFLNYRTMIVGQRNGRFVPRAVVGISLS
jgi:hypothetical protein